jgi:cell division protein FtsW (lipid II flippase)
LHFVFEKNIHFASKQITAMQSRRLSAIEIIVLAILLISLIIGYYLVYTDRPAFLKFTQEDGIVEWLTVLGLLLGAFTCLGRIIKLKSQKGWIFLTVTLLLAIVLIFGAGEEISWGQRIFHIKSPEYFKEHNAQGETNIHNLVLGGVRLNRWIFSILLTIVLLIYIVLIPFLYRTKNWMRRFVNHWGIPLPKPYQIIAFIILMGLTELMPDEKKAEIAEEGTAMLLFLITAFPINKKTFELKNTKETKSE